MCRDRLEYGLHGRGDRATQAGEGTPVQDSDLAHVWPTRYAHINMYGKYHFNVEEAQGRQGLQQLPQNLRRKDAEPGPPQCLHCCVLWRLICLKLCRCCFTSAPITRATTLAPKLSPFHRGSPWPKALNMSKRQRRFGEWSDHTLHQAVSWVSSTPLSGAQG